MRSSWSTVIVTAIITAIPVAIIAYFAGHGIDGQRDGNPVGPLHFNAVMSLGKLTSNNNDDVISECFHDSTDTCTMNIDLATTRMTSPNSTPVPVNCPTTDLTGCYEITGPATSSDAQTKNEPVNFTETLDFQSAHAPVKSNSVGAAKTGIPITSHTPNPADGNPVGFRGQAKATIKTQNGTLPACFATNSCKTISINLALPTEIDPTVSSCSPGGECITFTASEMDVKSLDWDGKPHPKNPHATEPKRNVVGTIYIGP